MADEENNNNAAAQEEEEEEEWVEPADVDGLPDGLTTTFVGGFSAFKSIADALEGAGAKRKPLPGDNFVVLPGTYDSDAIFDTAVHKGLTIVGDEKSAPADVVFTGQLALHFTQPTAAAANAAAASANDEEGAVVEKPPAPLLVGNMTFLAGAIFAELSDADVRNCVFGSRYIEHHTANSEDNATAGAARTVACHGLSTVRLNKCKIWGQLSGVYCFPYSRTVLTQCDIVGADKPPVPVQEAKTYRKKPAAAAANAAAASTPAAAAVVPASCEAEVGIELDNAESTFSECTVSNVNIGLLCRDASKKSKLERCAIAQVATVGMLLGQGASLTLRANRVKLCGRECLVVGSKAHPIVRDNIFVGDVRLKADAVATGICDNVVGLNGTVLEDSAVFAKRGFTVVANDPTAIKVKKTPVE